MREAYQIRDQNQLFFLSFQVVGWADIFSRKVCRDIFIDSLNYCRNIKGLFLYAYVIMPNHGYVLVQSKNGELSLNN